MTSSGKSAQSGAVVAALLEWYAEAGVDTIVLDRPRDRFAETLAEGGASPAGRPAVPAPPSPPADGGRTAAVQGSVRPAPSELEAFGFGGEAPAEVAAAFQDAAGSSGSAGPSAPRIAVPDDVALADARERARSASTLDELRAALASFEGCNLRISARSLVFGDGDGDADLMLIGEAPGREEDIAGVPFVGKSGQLLNRMLASIGIERGKVRVTNTVPWRPPGNRPPTPSEAAICLPFVARQIELVAPKVLVCLGSPSAKAILQTDEGILRLRGRWQSYGDGLSEGIPALPMLHPAYLLRQPAQKKLAWRDLLVLKQRLSELG